LNFALNLRTWANNTTFNAQEPWIYPKAKETYDPVALDKPSFGEPPVSLLGKGKSRQLTNQEKTTMKNLKYLSSDAGTPYTGQYRIKNVGEVRNLKTSTSNLPQLAWAVSLRPEDPSKLKRIAANAQKRQQNNNSIKNKDLKQ